MLFAINDNPILADVRSAGAQPVGTVRSGVLAEADFACQGGRVHARLIPFKFTVSDIGLYANEGISD